MIKLDLRLNGKPFRERDFVAALEQQARQSAIRQLEDNVRRIAGADAQRVRVTATGRGLADLGFTLSGPEDVIARITQALKD